MNRFANQKKGVALASYRGGNRGEGSSPSIAVSLSSGAINYVCAPPTPKRISKGRPFGEQAKRQARVVSPGLRKFFELVDGSALSYKELLRRSGHSRPGLNQWKMGKHSPAFHTIEEIAQILGYRIEWVKI